MLTAIAPAVVEFADFAVDQFVVSVEAHCEITEERLCVDLDDGSVSLNSDIETELDLNALDGQVTHAFDFQVPDEPSGEKPADEPAQGPPEVPNAPQEIPELVDSVRVSTIVVPAETSRLVYRAPLLPVSILPATEFRSSIGTDVLSSKEGKSNYFLTEPTQTASAPVIRSGLVTSHRTFSVIPVESALKSTTDAQQDTQLATQKTPARAVSQLHPESEEYVEILPSVPQTVAPILPRSLSMPESLIDENRPLIESKSKDAALARNLESAMILVLFYRRPERLPESDPKLAESR